MTARKRRGESDLGVLLRNMRPELDPKRFVFCTISARSARRLDAAPLGMFREAEGVTLILERKEAQRLGLGFDSQWRMIRCSIHSDLTAVGFLAAMSGSLAEAGISVNAVSAYYQDYLFVPAEKAGMALKILKGMRRGAVFRSNSTRLRDRASMSATLPYPSRRSCRGG